MTKTVIILIILALLAIFLYIIINLICCKNKDKFNVNDHIPIFIIVHDRLKVLKKTIESLKLIKTPYKIIFHDTNSTYPPIIKYLKDMERKGFKVYWNKKNIHTSVVNSVKDYYKKNKNLSYYVITDPDIELDNVNDDILEFYIYLLNKYKNKNVMCIGPMLRIDDIPDFYPKKEETIEGHTRQFWHKKPIVINYKNNNYKIQFSPIDTTFQLCSFDNILTKFPNPGIRCYHPYAARHLDWYIDPNNMSKDQIYYSNNASSIAHWGKFEKFI